MEIPSHELQALPNLKEFRWTNRFTIHELKDLIDFAISLQKLEVLDITLDKVLISRDTDNHWLCKYFDYSIKRT